MAEIIHVTLLPIWSNLCFVSKKDREKIGQNPFNWIDPQKLLFTNQALFSIYPKISAILTKNEQME